MQTTTLLLLTSFSALLTTGFIAPQAQADGFRCRGEQTGVQVAIYNNTDPKIGTRTPSIMVVSDPARLYPNKTIATFTSKNASLIFAGYGQYQGKLINGFAPNNEPNATIAGTTLGELKMVELRVKFSYNNAGNCNTDKDAVTGQIIYDKLNGEVINEKAVCSRYLKNN
jgi:uncharacterized membrane protein